MDFPKDNFNDMVAYYGRPGEVPLVRVQCPWTLRLDWDLQIETNKIAIHEKLVDSLNEILWAVHDHYGIEGIKELGLDRYGGAYNPRKKRNSRNSWSVHAYGAAIDWYPTQNRLRWGKDRASLAKPELDFWWEQWERQGWVSLGRQRDFDWMHVQAAKLR